MQEEKNNIKYTAEIIRKYLDGELSDPEMQALEKAALEDPFLADAIEGYEESRNHPISFESGLADLEKRLTARTGENERKTGMIILFSKWKVAASILFILGITIFTYKYINHKSRAELANTTGKDSSLENPASSPEKKTTDSINITSTQTVPGNAGSDTLGNGSITANEEEKLIRKEKSSPIARNKDVTPFKKKTENPYPESLSRESAGTDSESAGYAKSAKKDVQPVLFPKAVSEPNEKVSGRIIQDKKSSEYFIKGVVVDNKGKPIPFATVKIKGSGNGTITDTGGLFKLYMKNPGITAELEFIHPGYERATAELIPDSTFTNKVQLHEIESSLSEVTVTEKADVARSRKSPEAFYESKKTDKPSTLLGWEDFINYINKNKKIVSADSLLKGEEIISFMLYPDGQLSSFKIEKSISPAHDAEILRLIKAAPALKVQNAQKQKCRINISFP